MSSEVMLEVNGLNASIGGKKILNGIDMTVRAGEIHAIMGPNGSGKSTLAKVLSGDPAVTVESGSVLYRGRDLLSMEAEDRALEGIFLAFQYPVEIPGVNNAAFLRTAFNSRRKFAGLDEMDPIEFEDVLKERAKIVDIPDAFFDRSVNHGFSGGEKKRNEIFQMAVLEPSLAVLDETDSGLDVDALRVVASGVNRLRKPDNAMILVTHYQRILNYIIPDFVHVLSAGKMVRSGDRSLALEIEEKGFEGISSAKQKEAPKGSSFLE